MYKIKNYSSLYQPLVSFFNSNQFFPIHRWYSFVEGYSTELVRQIICEQKKIPTSCFDPFGGVGTTSLTCQNMNIECTSIEVNPFMYDLARTKLRTDYSILTLKNIISNFKTFQKSCRAKPLRPSLDSKSFFEDESLEKWIFDEEVTNGILDILKFINTLKGNQSKYKPLLKSILASFLVEISNVFRNGKALSYKKNWPSINHSRKEIHERFISITENKIIPDLRFKEISLNSVDNFNNFILGDSRKEIQNIPSRSIDLIITSPPYLNSRDYTDIYRLELWVLGYISNYKSERKLRKETLTSHVQIKHPDHEVLSIKKLIEFINHLEIDESKLWNKGIPNMIKGYFCEMQLLMRELFRILRKGKMAYINVSNSAYCGKVCFVDEILAEIAENIGFEVKEIRIARNIKSSSQQNLHNKLRESIIVLRKN